MRILFQLGDESYEQFKLRSEDWLPKLYYKLKPGMWEIDVRKPKRTKDQNKLIHALFSDLAVELNGLGVTFNVGNFQASMTERTAKEFFVLCYLGGKRTSDCDTREISDAVEKLIHDVNAKGGSLSIKDPKGIKE